MKFSGTNTVSIKKRFAKLNRLFLIFTILFVLVSVTGMLSLSMFRAYATGAGYWANARRDIVWHLDRYIDTGEESEYISYQEALRPLLGYKKAHIEIFSDHTDFQKASEGMIEGGNLASDAFLMGVTFKLLNDFPYLRQCAADWTAGTLLVDQLIDQALTWRNDFQTWKNVPALKTKNRRLLLDLSDEIHKVEDSFSRNVDIASQFAATMLIGISILFGMGAGLYLWSWSRRTYSNVLLGLKDISDGAWQMVAGEFGTKIATQSNLEFQILANTINEMGVALNKGLQNLTERNEALQTSEQTIAASAQKYKNLVDAISELAVVMVTDPQGVVKSVSRSFEGFSGYSCEELIGQTPRLIKSGKHDAEFYVNMWQTIKSGKLWRGEVCNRNKSGAYYWVFATIFPIFQNGEIVEFFSIRFNITKEKQARDQMANLARLSSIGEMAGGIAHEINTPLSTIMLRTESLIRKLESEGEKSVGLVAMAQAILPAIHRITKIVQTVRRLSFNTSGAALTSNKVEQIIADATDLCRDRFMNQGIEIRQTTILDCLVRCRPTELSQVLVNLLNNSFNAIKDLDEKWVEISVLEKDNKVQVLLTDSGHGIPHHIAEKMMDPFVTTGEVGSGLGIGLSLSAKILDDHGGRLYFDDSFPNTRFVIELPRA